MNYLDFTRQKIRSVSKRDNLISIYLLRLKDYINLKGFEKKSYGLMKDHMSWIYQIDWQLCAYLEKHDLPLIGIQFLLNITYRRHKVKIKQNFVNSTQLFCRIWRKVKLLKPPGTRNEFITGNYTHLIQCINLRLSFQSANKIRMRICSNQL